MPNTIPSASSTQLLRTALALLLGLPIATVTAATFSWDNTTGVWSDAARWGGLAPSGADATDILIFGGDVGAVAGVAPNYVATEDLAGTPFLLNQLTLNATDPGATGLTQRIIASPAAKGLRFGGAGPQIVQNGVGGFALDLPMELTAPLTLTGNGAGVVTLNFALTGAADIVKNGSSTYRLGTPFSSTTIPTTGPSANAWVGRLTINDGTIRFNNTADSGRTALRANPVVLTSALAQLTATSELRTGTLSGAAGNVQTVVSGNNTASTSIVIHALSDGSYGGTLKIDPRSGTGANDGILVVRGAAKQTLTGPLSLAFVSAVTTTGADIEIGRSATLALAGAATLGGDSRGAVILAGGTFQLDNVATNNPNRLRDAGTGSTGLDTKGGGAFQLIGNAAGTIETIGRFQISGAATTSVRSGAVTIGVVQSAASSALNISSYNRLSVANAFVTVDFTGSGGTLGASATSPRILFTLVPVVASFNGLIGNNDTVAIASSVGWATVDGAHFASYSGNGVIAVAATAFNPAVSSATTNAVLTGSASVTLGSTFSQNSLRLAPVAAGQSLSIAGAGNLDTNGVLLAGANDFTIANSGGGTGGYAGTNTRYVHVQQAVLTLGLNAGAANFPLVKSGAGTLALTNPANAAATFTTAINAGSLRANPSTTLSGGPLQLRGGVLEIEGGGTFTRPLGGAAGQVNWASTVSGQDQGSGGFAAFGADATVTIGGNNATVFAWESANFLTSGYALMFGSPRADRRVTFTNPLSLSALAGSVNYNAREIRAVHNPAAANDTATLSGIVSGTLQNDLLKTGSGTLELTAPNTFLGTTIVLEGALLVNGSTASSILADVRAGATLGGSGTTGPVQIGGAAKLAPGDTAGHTSVLSTGNLKFTDSTSTYAVQIGGIVVGGNGTTGYDQVGVTGSLALNGASLAGSLLGGFTPTPGDLFFLLNNDGIDPVTGLFLQGANTTFDGTTFDISYTGDFGTNAFSAAGGNDVVLRVVPEPSTLALLFASGLLAGRRRRRVVSLPR